MNGKQSLGDGMSDDNRAIKYFKYKMTIYFSEVTNLSKDHFSFMEHLVI
jgi:hypothetical protein